MPIIDAIRSVRQSTCAILRVRREEEATDDAGETEVELSLAFVGSGVCIVEDELVLTAHHVLNSGEPRDPDDDFYVLCVPENQRAAYHYPVVDFPLEYGDRDVAILRIGDPSSEEASLAPLTCTNEDFPDGTRVVTCGFPSPDVSDAQFDGQLRFRGGEFFLKSHANTGIIAAQYELDNGSFYEFNVGWHHGESGGPVVIAETQAVFSLMQQYRNIETPHGVTAGPHIGPALSDTDISVRLEQLGAEFT